MKRVLSLLLAGGIAATFLNGCAGKLDYRPELQQILRHTEAVNRAYTYTMRYAGHDAVVNVLIDDDFRYQAVYTLDGKPEAQEIVRDDVRAVQVKDRALLAGLKPGVQQSTNLGAQGIVQGVQAEVPVGGFVSAKPSISAATLAALRKGEWVQDPEGAYKILRTVQNQRPPTPGADQVGDALKILSQLDAYIGTLGAGQVVRYNPEAGYYFKDLDPFPKPGSGVRRYDISLSPQLPPRSGLQDSPAQRQAAVPLADYFLSAAVYVRNGAVISIRESVNIGLRLRLPDQDLVTRMRDASIKLPGDFSKLSLDGQGTAIDKALNAFYGQHQNPALVQRYVEVDFGPSGSVGPITLPPSTVSGSLTGIFERGQILGGGS